MKRNYLPIIAPLLIFLIVGLACKTPFSQPVEEILDEETPAVVVEAPAVVDEETEESVIQVPPDLVECDPISGSTIAFNQSIILYFNQPMNENRVVDHIQVEPPLEMKYTWIDDSTLEMSLVEPPPLNDLLIITIEEGVQGQNGLSANEASILSFQTPGSLLLTDQLPAEDAVSVNPHGVIMVSFNQPVVLLGAGEVPDAFVLSPDAGGRGEWLNTSTYIYTPDPSLGGGINYTVSLNRGLTSLYGAPLELLEGQSQNWTFTTSLPRLLMVEPFEQQNMPIDASFVLTFNQSMDAQAVEENFSVQDSSNQSVNGVFNWNEDFSVLTYKPGNLLERNTTYQLQLGSMAESMGGTPLGKDQAYSFLTVGNLRVTQTNPSLSAPLPIYSGYTSLQITFSSPLRETTFQEMVKFVPAIGDPSYYLNDAHTLVVSGYFSGNTDYALTISESLEDRWGQSLGLPYSMAFKTGSIQPSLSIPLLQYGEQILFMTTGDQAIPGRATNLSAVDVSADLLSLNQFTSLVNQRELLWDYEPEGGEFWRQTLNLPGNINYPVNISVQRSEEPLPTGVYYYKIDSSQLEYALQPFMLVVSDIHMVIKRSKSQLFIWAVDLRSNSPFADTILQVYQGGTTASLNCVTDHTGKCEILLPENLDPYDPLVVVYGEPGDEDFALGLDGWLMGVSGWDFGIETTRSQDDLFSYIYTDRAIYRPGQSVNFRVILREVENARYSLAELAQLHIEVYGDYIAATGEVPLMETIPITLSSFGSGSGTFLLPEDAPPGYYSLRITELGDSYLGFQVAEYRKPEIDLGAMFTHSDALHGENLSVNIQADYFFGAPASQVPFHWTLYARDSFYSLPYGYQTGKQDLSWVDFGFRFRFPLPLGNYVLDGDGQTLADGSYQLEIPYDDLIEKLDPESIQLLNLELTLEDDSMSPVSTQTSIVLHPERFYIGIRPEQWNGISGTALGFSIQTADWAKTAVPEKLLEAGFQKVTWVQEEDDFTGYIKSVPKYEQISSTGLKTDLNGQARIEFTPSDAGTYLVTVRSEQALSQVLVWVGGPGSTRWPTLPNQQLLITSDTHAYAPGQTAKIFIPNPFESGLALITVERSKVMRSFVVPVEGAQLEYDIELFPEDAPNVYIAVTLLNDPQNGNLDFRQGYLSLDIDPEEFTLDVQILREEIQLYPRDDLIMSLLVTDHDGNPVEGEFSLSLVDKAVLALAQPNAAGIEEAFYGSQPLGVLNSISLAAYIGRFPGAGADGIGGGGEGLAAPFIRQDFKDTAYWSGMINTDENGRAEIQIKVPDNLTTWVATVRGLTNDTLVGETEIEIIVSKDLIIRPVTPRFMVAGDQVQIGALVHNYTSESLPIDVSLQAVGFLLDDEESHLQRIVLSPGEVKRVDWLGTTLDVEAVELIFSAQAGSLQDAATPELGSIPVLHYVAHQSYGTSGYLDDASEILEGISIPRSFEPTGGQLIVEIAPSLAASILKEMQVLQTYHKDFNETVISQMLPNLEMLKALREFGLETSTLEEELISEISMGIDRLSLNRNSNGGWGWTTSVDSDTFISSYVLFGLSKAQEAGFFIEPDVILNAQDYLFSSLPIPNLLEQSWQLDRMVFQHFALQISGFGSMDSSVIYDYKDRLNPWAKALLALTLEEQKAGNESSANLIAELQSTAGQTSTGVYWTDEYPSWQNNSSTNFNTAVVLYSLAKLDPAVQAVPLATRFLSKHRQVEGGWSSSYETAWVLIALTEVMRGTGELQADYTYSATLNNMQIIAGQAAGIDSLTTIVSTTPINDLLPETPNALKITRQAGGGRLNYRAFLQVFRSVEDVQPLHKGLSVERKYEVLDSECFQDNCEDAVEYSLGQNQNPILVRLTITIPTEMHYLVVEDWIPAGSEIVDTSLKNTLLGQPIEVENELEDPPANLWRSIYFNQPAVYDDHIRWVASWVPAGTYELTYRLTPYLAGKFQVLPAHAHQYYFPDVEGSSAGEIFTILP